MPYPKHRWNLFITLGWNFAILIPMIFVVKCIIASFSYAIFGSLALVLLLGKFGTFVISIYSHKQAFSTTLDNTNSH